MLHPYRHNFDGFSEQSILLIVEIIAVIDGKYSQSFPISVPIYLQSNSNQMRV